MFSGTQLKWVSGVQTWEDGITYYPPGQLSNDPRQSRSGTQTAVALDVLQYSVTTQSTFEAHSPPGVGEEEAEADGADEADIELDADSETEAEAEEAAEEAAADEAED
jgi:hypothetical protein